MNRRKTFSFSVILTITIFVLSVILFFKNMHSLSENSLQTQAESLQNALIRSAVHCYAAEGRYPESLEYLQEEYGIRWDTEQYTVDYEVFASNLLPSISVIPLS